MKPSFYCRARRRANWEYDNNQKIKNANENFKKAIIEMAIKNLNNMDNLNEKLNYIHRLKTDTYRRGTKYKYECNLSEYEIKQILDRCNDELFTAYYGKNKEQYNEDSNMTLLWVIIISILLIIFNIAIR